MDTKQNLIQTAGKLFAERGFDGTSIKDITEAAGANLAAINYHFRSKEALFAAVVQQAIESLNKTLKQIGEGEELPTDKLSKIFREYIFYALHKEPGLKALLLDIIHGGHHLPKEPHQALAWQHHLIGNILREGIRKEAFRHCEIEHVTYIFFGMLTTIILYQPLIKPVSKDQPHSQSNVKRIVNTALSLFMNGLTKRTDNDKLSLVKELPQKTS